MTVGDTLCLEWDDSLPKPGPPPRRVPSTSGPTSPPRLTRAEARAPSTGTLRLMLHHLTLWVPDLRRAEASWGWLLGELGYTQDRSLGAVVLFRHTSGFAVALEQSSDMVPGMLYSRMRPGLNHIAFALGSESVLSGIVGEAGNHGWLTLPIDGHPIAGGAHVGYLEDGDGFEVELVAPAGS